MSSEGLSCTKHVSRSRLEAEYFLVLQCLGKSNEQARSSLEAVDGIRLVHLQAARHDGEVQLLQTGAVDLAGLPGVAAEGAGLEHLETGDGKAFAAAVDLARLLALVLPLGAGAGIEQDGHEEEVEQAACALRVVDSGRPRRHQLVDSRAAADLKVLPAAVGRDLGVVGGVVSLWWVSWCAAHGVGVGVGVGQGAAAWCIAWCIQVRTFTMDTTKLATSVNLLMSTVKCFSWFFLAFSSTRRERSRTA